jgi:superoxide reductase
MSERKFFLCEHCKNLVASIKDSGVPMMCCGQKMTALEANTVEASQEKHLPVVTVNGNEVTVAVGSVAHPMLEEHLIEWVYLLTDKGIQRKSLSAGGEPVAKFALLEGEKPLAAYEYCNLHGLWKTEIK